MINFVPYLTYKCVHNVWILPKQSHVIQSVCGVAARQACPKPFYLHGQAHFMSVEILIILVYMAPKKYTEGFCKDSKYSQVLLVM